MTLNIESPQGRDQSQSATHPVLVMIANATHFIKSRLGGLYRVKININLSNKYFNWLVQRIRTRLLFFMKISTNVSTKLSACILPASNNINNTMLEGVRERYTLYSFQKLHTL